MSEDLTTREASMQANAGLLEYLKTAIDLENSVLTQKGIIQNYDASSERRKPVLELMDEVKTPKEPIIPEPSNGFRIILGIVGGFFALCGWINISSKLWLSLLMGLLAAFFFWQMRRDKLADQEKVARCKREYQEAMEKYKRIRHENANREAQYQSKLWEWNESNKSAHAYFEKPLAQTQAVLDELYSREVIYPKYHNLPALTSIYEYLVTGRCEALSGAHGAYNLYEDEVRKDTVISQLNTVIENLEQIKQNQYMLYEQVKQIQQNTRAIASELYAIRGYTAVLTELSALNAYYAGVTAMNTTALNYCRLLE